jgi:HAE1 family hydrophobic/amphiphilic exporter-1
MNPAESSVRYPITVIVRVLLVLVFGYVCLTFLEVELKPDTQPPVIAIITDYPGAAPEEVEGQVTNRFEQYISGVSNLIATFGYCYFGRSFIFVLYHPGTNLDLAAAELQRNLDRVSYLPPEVQRPQILKATDYVNLPVYQFALTGDVNPVDMTTWADLEIVPRIKRIHGVGDCLFRGARTRQMRISFDMERLKARRLTVNDVKRFIDRSNLNRSAGYFNNGPFEWTVRVIGELKDAEDFGRVIITKPGEPPLYLSDVARIRDMYERPDAYCRIDGVPGLIFNVYNEVGADILRLIHTVDGRLGKMQREYGPKGVKFAKTFDQGVFIRDAVGVVKGCLLQAGVLILLVLFLFLKRWRSILIVAISIPVSVVGTFIGMYLFGYSINVISLAGIALAIGMIVDDSIVVLENIHRHRYEEGKSPFQACVDGTREVGRAAIMSTLTIAAVFVPVLMLKGEIGALFGPVAFVVSFAIFVSLLDAFTVVPMLSYRWMGEEREPNRLMEGLMRPLSLLDGLGRAFSSAVIGSLRFFLKKGFRKVVLVAGGLGLFALSCAVLPGFNYLPVGGSNIVRMDIECVQGTGLERKSRLLKILEKRWKRIKGVMHVVSVPNRNMFENRIYLVCEDESISGIPVEEISRKAFETSRDLPFRTVNPIRFPLFGNVYLRSDVVDLRVVGRSYDVIRKLVDQIMEIGRNTKGVLYRYTDLALRKPQIAVRVDRERAHNLGLQVRDIADAVEAAVGGRRTVTQYDVKQHYFYIRIMGAQREVSDLFDIKNIVLTSPENPNVQIPLSSVAAVEPTYGPMHITHFNSQRSSRVQFTVKDRPLAEVFHEVMGKIKSKVAFPHGYAAIPFGSIKELGRLTSAIRFVFPLSAVVVYLLLVLQFQSFLRPLSIMLSVPLSLIGSNFVVRLLHVPFDAFTMLGYIMMTGLVVKNAILLVTYAVRLIDDEGMDREDALILAAERRIRPIYMTSVAMIFGMLPLALTTGPAAEIYNGLATVVVAGLVLSSLLTLVFIPVVFVLLDDLKKRFWKSPGPGPGTTIPPMETDSGVPVTTA